VNRSYLSLASSHAGPPGDPFWVGSGGKGLADHADHAARVRGYDRLIERLLPNLDLLAAVDSGTSKTARYSDYVFPAAGWYEQDDITWGSPITPFAHVTTRALPPGPGDRAPPRGCLLC
jgi:nitrate reductase alpha subunit